MLKNSVIGMSFRLTAAEFFVLTSLRGSLHSGYGRLAEEAGQSLKVLGSRCQEELLPHERNPTC